MFKYLALIIPLPLIILIAPVFAQQVNDTGTSELQVNATTHEPILQQKSDKGIYNVLLKWPEAIDNPQAGIQVEIVFLNASAPPPTPANIPQTETNNTGASALQDPGFNVPGIIESTLAVKSYDMTIYGNDGKELWKKVNQPGQGGRGTQDIQFGGNITGPITIKISNITPGWLTPGTAEAKDLTDSVTFTTSVVPEFPVAGALFAATVAVTVAAVRLRSRIMKLS